MIHTHVSSAASARSSAAFVVSAIGRSANAIDLFVPPAPAVHASADLKARSFDFLADLLQSHSALHSSAELIAAFNHVPSSSYNAALVLWFAWQTDKHLADQNWNEPQSSQSKLGAAAVGGGAAGGSILGDRQAASHKACWDFTLVHPI
jgi:hypothetical protein